jgi:hypothetical protein
LKWEYEEHYPGPKSYLKLRAKVQSNRIIDSQKPGHLELDKKRELYKIVLESEQEKETTLLQEN